MILSPGAKVQPNLSTLRSPAGLSAACSSMFKERAPTPPRFIGHRTCMSRMGSSPNRLGMCLNQLDDASDGCLGVFGLDEIEVAVVLRRIEIGDQALVDTVGAGDNPAL